MIKKLSLALIIAIIFTAIPVFSVEVNAVTEETITAPSARAYGNFIGQNIV